MNVKTGAEKEEHFLNNRKVRVGAVSYLNTKPLTYGFEKGMMKEEVELLFDYPSNIAAALLNGSIDIGLVPVAVIPEMEQHHIIGDHCIAADGPVASVCLFSEVPLHQVSTILLDYQSRTSVLLVQYLVKEYWKTDPVFINTTDDFTSQIKGTTAAVVIGDRAFRQRKISTFSYDLAEAWKKHTGLPFVFAAWISNKPMPSTFVAAFNKANEYGFEHLNEVVAQNPFTDFDLEKYYNSFVQYRLDDSKRKGLELFLQYCSAVASEQHPA